MSSSIFNFVKKLLPRIDRHTVAEDLRTTEKEAVNVVMPSWDAAADFFRINKPKSEEAEGMKQVFYRIFDMRRAMKAPTFIEDISRRLPDLHKNILYLQSVLDDMLEKDILADGLTAKSAFILRSSSNISLITRYLSSLLNYLYTAEAKAADQALDAELEISIAEMKYVDQNFVRFAQLFSEYTQPLKEIIGELPEIFLAKQSEDAVRGVAGISNVDPFDKYGIAGLVGNPIYRVRLVIAKWQNDRYESAKAKKQQLELRLLYLKMQKEEEKDPAVVKEIERLQGRIEGYDRYLREVEENVEEKD